MDSPSPVCVLSRTVCMPLALVSMALSAAEAKAETTMAEPLPKYPWGLQLDLNDDVLEKLGLKDLPAVGAVLLLRAKVEVVSTSESERQGGALSRCLGLQVTDLQLDAAPLARKDAATVFYGGDAA